MRFAPGFSLFWLLSRPDAEVERHPDFQVKQADEPPERG
jgi:hypothetical protein